MLFQIAMVGCCTPYCYKWFQMTLLLSLHAQQMVTKNLKLLSLSVFLQEEVESSERSVFLTKHRNTNKDTQSSHRQHCKPDSVSGDKWKRTNVPSALALYTSNTDTPFVPRLFCDSASYKSEQSTDNMVARRKEKLKKMGRCFKTTTHC